jgi:ATP-dependent helicase/nuclease subunit B
MNIYNIQAGRNFAHIFCNYILQKYADNLLDITNLTIWVPSSRIATTIKDTFYSINGDMLLPQIKPFNLGEEAEEEILFNSNTKKQEAISLIEKRLILTKQVHAKDQDKSIAHAMKGADELLKLHNRMLTWGVNIEDIHEIVPDELASHWQQNLLFLDIVFQFYPQWLALQNKLDPVELRQNLLYETAIQLNNTNNPVMAVGFTDTTPAGMAMLKAILNHPKGSLILPSVDMQMADEIWQNLPEIHPQYSIKNLLEKLEVTRQDIATLGENTPTKEAICWQQILSPAFSNTQNIPKLENITLLEANNETEESESIALIMRETLEHKNKTCTLVTSENTLAERVEAFLKKWDIVVDNSAGKPLTQTSIGEFFCNILAVISKRFSPLSLATVLHHDDIYIAENYNIKALENTVLRGIIPPQGIAGLRYKLTQSMYNFRVSDEDREQSGEFINLIENTWKPLLTSKKYVFEKWLQIHFEVLQSISKREKWQLRDDGNALIQFLSSWQEHGSVIGEISFNDYAQIVQQLLKQVTVRKKSNTHPRLFICGALEARLKKHDRLILANVNEGTWPRKYTPDPWLNPIMEEEVGLPNVDMAVGLGAQDFCSLACSNEVFVTRAIKKGGEETVPSRFLTRFSVCLQNSYQNAQNKGNIWLKWLRNSKQNLTLNVSKQPVEVAPLLENRPQIWSASFTKDMMQCPYKAYIGKILNMHKIDGYEEVPSAADKGNLFHNCLESFFVGNIAFNQDLTVENQQQALEHLLIISDELFKQTLKSSPATYAIWWPRFKLIAADFIQQLLKLSTKPTYYEKEGRITLKSGVQLRARADRIDNSQEGACIIDYKTGEPPSVKDVRYGTEPQMAVEATILAENGYGKLTCAGAEFWHLKGSGSVGVQTREAIGKKDLDIENWIEDSKAGLEKLTKHFNNPQNSYKAIPSGSKFKKEKQCIYCDYEGVCRFKEWIE